MIPDFLLSILEADPTLQEYVYNRYLQINMQNGVKSQICPQQISCTMDTSTYPVVPNVIEQILHANKQHQNTGTNLNFQMTIITHGQKEILKKEKIKQQKKNYYNKNKETIIQRQLERQLERQRELVKQMN